MSLPEPPPRRPDAHLRVADRERDEVAAQLRVDCAAGRLTLEELDARLDAVAGARTRGDLERVLEDLPRSPDRAVAPRAGDARVTHRGWAVALLADEVRTGRWIPGPRTGGVAVLANVEIDLRGAEVTGPVIDVEAYALLGKVVVIVPEGAAVEVSGGRFLGATKIEVDGAPRPGVPTVRVRAVPLLGDVHIRSSPRPPGFFARTFRRGGRRG